MAALRGMLLCSHGARAPSSRGRRRRYSCSSLHVAAAANTDLKTWVSKQGGFVWTNLHIMHTGDSSGLELIGSGDLPKGSTVLSLPRRVPLEMPNPEGDTPLSPMDTVISELAARIPEELWSLRLGLKLLSERAQKNSYWTPYISMLPKTFSLPIFFSGEDIENIDYLPVTHQVKMRCRYLLQVAKELPALDRLPEGFHPFGGQIVDSGALGWAMAAVSSRAFRIHGVPNKLCTGMMLPMIDMCNHSFQANACIVEDLSKEVRDVSFLKVVTERDLKKGEPITLNYGPLSNDFLLLDYGFVIPDNPYDRIELKYDGVLMENSRIIAGLSETNSPSFDSPAPWQQELLKQLGLLDPGESQKVTLGGPELVDGRLLAALRILHAETPLESSKDLDLLKTWGAEKIFGMENEERVLRTLCALGAFVLNQFKTNIEQDESKLADKDLPSTTRLAIQFRLTKKKVTLRALEGLKNKLMELRAGASV